LFRNSNQVRLAGLEAANDRAVWEFAKTNGFAIVSQDSDFADMAALYGPPPKVIWCVAAIKRTSSSKNHSAIMPKRSAHLKRTPAPHAGNFIKPVKR